MSKLLLFADPHVHAHRNSQDRLKDCLEAFDWVFQVARDNGVKDVVCLGDLFHDRQKIQVYTYFQVYETIRRYPDINVTLLLGNHDLWFYERLDVSSVHPFGSLPNVTVIDRPCARRVGDLDIDFLPFTHNPIECIQDNFPTRSRVMCGHIALDGANLNLRHNVRAEVSVEIDNDIVKVDRAALAGWDRVFLGHYHGAQKLGHVEYVGSLLQLSFGEAMQQKHVILLNADTLETEYVVNDFSPKHYVLSASEVAKYDLSNAFVRVEVEDIGAADLVDLKEDLRANNVLRLLEFTEVKTPKEVGPDEGAVDKFNLVDGDILERFVKVKGPNGLDEGELLALGRQLAVESNQGK